MIKTISSGSTLLNLALTNTVNGGWSIGRISNIVGDYSSGKTLLALEAIMSCHYILGKKYRVKLIYDDTESALDIDLAKQIGVPVENIDFRESNTVEDFYKNLSDEIEKSDYDLLLYVLDSLDALSTKEELDIRFDEGTYGTQKARQMSKLFRKLTSRIKEKNIHLLIISQLRDKIGISFGEKQGRTGGRALDFYASQIVWLHEKKKILKNNIPAGIEIRAKVKKNKIWKPFRMADISILFGYGIDDTGSMIDYLKENNKKVLNCRGPWIEYNNKKYKGKEELIKYIEENNEIDKLKLMVKSTWDEMEKESITVRRPKYDDSTDHIN